MDWYLYKISHLVENTFARLKHYRSIPHATTSPSATISWPYTRQIVEALSQEVPVIVFAKGCWYALEEMSQSKAAALGVDWTCSPEMTRKLTGGKKVLQGNLDPAWLLAPISQIKEKTQQMIRAFGKEHYIANLGHGILPHVPVAHAQAFIECLARSACSIDLPTFQGFG